MVFWGWHLVNSRRQEEEEEEEEDQQQTNAQNTKSKRLIYPEHDA